MGSTDSAKPTWGRSVRVVWGDRVLEERFLRPGEGAAFSVGPTIDASFGLLHRRLPSGRCELVREGEGGFELCVPRGVGEAGGVRDARVTTNTSGDPALQRCLVSRVRTWQFPKPRGGGEVVVTYPFLFKPAGE